MNSGHFPDSLYKYTSELAGCDWQPGHRNECMRQGLKAMEITAHSCCMAEQSINAFSVRYTSGRNGSLPRGRITEVFSA